MSANGANVEDTEMAECEGEKVVTMMDVLQEQQEFEEDANAVLGASDDKNCTYSKGYIKRQAVYACLTCCSDAKHDPDKRAGVCLACSLTCHENHDLVELYTKRNFRCDCGNPKFSHPCQYTENKSTLNDENIYNQNFSGLYCTCHRPYPDPDGVEEEMIQCIVCEDWLHASHLEASVPSSELYAEMICKACMDKNEFLHDYSKYAVNGDVNVVDTIEVLDSSIHCNGDTNKMNTVDKIEDVDKVESEEDISVPDEMKEIDNPTEATNTSHDNIDDNKPEEQMQPNDTVSEKTDNENPLEKNKAEHTESENTGDENSIEDHTKDTDKTDDPNSTEENKAKDTNEGDTPTSNQASDNILGDNLDSAVSSGGQENLDEKSTKVDGTTDDTAVNSAEQNKQENHPDNPQESNGNDVNGDQKVDGNPQESNGNDANGDQKVDGNPQESNGDDANGHQKIDGDPQESNGMELASYDANGDQKIDGNPQESNGDDANGHQKVDGNPQESNGMELASYDANGYQKVDGKIGEDLEIDGQEKQEDHADSTLVSDANKNIETPQVPDNRLEDEIKENKRKLSMEETTLDISAKKPKLSESGCLRPKGQKKMFKGATFWPCHFRQKLCTCNECITMYKDLAVLFLIDPEDTVTAYEVLGKEKTDGSASTQYEKGLEALSSLGRIQQINALTEYNKMRDKLLDFLKSFKDRKEIVKEEDIKAFFAGMKPKREPDGVYFCR